MSFGKNNDYPQIVEKLILGSQTAKACRSIYAKFIGGSSFENPEIGKVIIGVDKYGKSVTLDKIRRDAAMSIAAHNGVFIHCDENLEGQIGKTKVVPFKNCRFSNPDALGYSGKIAVHPNWAKDTEFQKFDKKDIAWFHNFNISAISENVKDSGGIDKEGNFAGFKGQIYFFSIDDSYLYPLSPFDSVYLDMDTEYQIQLYKNREIRDGFSDKAIILIDPPDDDKEREETVEKIQKMMGPDGGRVVILEATFDKETGQLAANSTFKVEKIPTTINDKLFENWEKSLANNIRKAIKALPAVLIDYEQGKLSQASGEMLVEAVNYYNALTQSDREAFSELFKDIYSHSADETLKNNADWRIKPFSLKDSLKVDENSDESILTEKRKSQAVLRGSVGGVTALIQLQQSVSAGTTDINAAIAIVEEIYGINHDAAVKMIGTPKQTSNGTPTLMG
jgi:hypothetical protein